MKKYFILFIIFSFSIGLFSQETIVGIGNPFLKEFSKTYFEKNNSATKNSDTLDLPFFDDFAASFVYPDETKWIDMFAFINNDYAIDPISYGVATLDAINQFGSVYPYLPSISSAIADFLTSKPINLEVSPSDSVYLSFFYQAGGKGNVPEFRDSLVLQFKTPELDWKSVWRKPGGEMMETFKLVMIPITQPEYLTKGFQFRFLNYASVSTNYEPSWVSNTDHWHLDYIKLDTARSHSDTIINDVAVIRNATSLIDGFESVPWNHYLAAGQEFMKDSLSYVYKSNYVDDVININRQFEIVDMYGSDLGYLMDDDNENISPLETIEFIKKINYEFNSDSEDSARFMIKSYIKTDLTEDRYIYRWNDTVRYYQNFYNYYAYDDGTAEAGYGITGQNTAYSSLAYRFTPLTTDTLRGAYIYFNQVMNEANRKYFFFTIWADNDGIPGDTIYQQLGVIPEYSDEVNGFLFYELDTALIIDTTFYIGWTKTTDDMLNCGFDFNRIANQHLFFNISGEWQNSQIEGALMMRPVFGYKPPQIIHVPISNLQNEFNVFPNPASESISISSDKIYEKLEVYDSTGKLILSQAYRDNYDISSLPAGMYFVKLKSSVDIFRINKLLILR